MSDHEAGSTSSDAAALCGENRDLRAQIASLQARLDLIDQSKTDFITIASHELRTPLTQLRGYADILDALAEDGTLDAEQTTSLIGNIRRASERMEELLTTMLDASQLDLQALDLHKTDVSLESVVRMAVEPSVDAIRRRHIALSARGLRGLPPVQADMQRLVQAVRAVVGNAIKFTPDGGRVEINAHLRPANAGQDSAILISVADTGVGIAPEHLDLIFQKFFRGYDPALHSTGTSKFMGAGPGLGLTIARGVIQGHGGALWAESAGHSLERLPGSTFFVLLPVNVGGVSPDAPPHST